MKVPGSLALLLCAVAACATGRGPAEQEALLTDRTDLAERCTIVELPVALPAADALVDSAALGARIREYAVSLDEPTAGYVLLSMAYDTTGMNIRREVIEHRTTATVADSIQKLVFAELRTIDAEELPWNLRLRVDIADDGVGLRVGRSELCPPRPLDPAVESRTYGVQATGVRYRRGAQERVILVRLEVGPLGYVRRADVVRGPPMTTDLQRQISDYSRQLFFQPATIDGLPTTGWIEIPLTLRG